MDILAEIADRTRTRVAEKKARIPTSEIAAQATALLTAMPVGEFAFESALRRCDSVKFICEIKKASPSKGVISEDFPYVKIAREYEAAGGAAVSVLTEPFYFKGKDSYLEEVRRAINIPVLRKDFTVDEYMIYEAKVFGADAVLIICAITDKDDLPRYIKTAHSLGLSALVETRDEREIETALTAGARIIGVNNRDLKTFEVDIAVSERLRGLVPKDKIFVSESGIRTHDDVVKLREMGADAALIGETLMRSPDKTRALEILRNG